VNVNRKKGDEKTLVNIKKLFFDKTYCLSTHNRSHLPTSHFLCHSLIKIQNLLN
jgi:hypothetical protein